MSIESDLKREGIEVTSIIDNNKVNSIAKEVSTILSNSFPEHNFNLEELYISLSQIPMYRATVPKGFSEANYLYKNSSIYFNEEIPIKDLTNYAIHECVHYLQTRKDNWGNLLKLGLCDLTQFNVHGLGINEAAVQYITAKALKSPLDTVKYYGITFDTISPNCYPLVCNLISQMAYITGEYVLLDSTFNSTNDFKNTFINKTSSTTYATLEKNFDKILKVEEDLIKSTNKLENSETTNPSLNKHISYLKNSILSLFTETQNLIITSYFEKSFNEITNLEELENYRRKLYNFKPLIGILDGENFYNTFYIDMMIKLEARYNELENGYSDLEDVSLATVKTNTFFTLIQKLKKLLFKSGSEYSKVDINNK